MKNSRKLVLIISLLTIAFTSCKKNEDAKDNELATSEDMALSENVYDQVFKEVDGNATDAGLKKGYPIITIDTLANPKSMTINYGDTNFLCRDGNYRRGKILVSWTGRYRDNGTIITTTFDGFYQNDFKVEGTKTVTNIGRNNEGFLVFNISVQGKITNTENQSITWNSTRTRTWIAGENTPRLWTDDKYLIEGSTNGVNRNGFTFTSVITKPLTIDLGCQWRIVSGTVELTPQGKPTRTIDYGNGACDRLATVTVNGRTFNITMRR
ncbi:MAG: hypothetical protein ACK4K9_02730 [Bacteroidia bacterium]